MRGVGTIFAGIILWGSCSFDTSSVNGTDGTTLDDLTNADAGPQADAAPTLDAAVTPVPDAEVDAAPPPEGVLQSYRTQDTLIFDGELDPAWLAVPFRHFDIDAAGQYLSTDSYDPDASVRFASLYDDENIYFFFEIKDDQLVRDSENIYSDDSIELYLDGAGDASGPYSDDDHWITIGTDGLFQSLGSAAVPPAGETIQTETGYNIELHIARADLGVPDDATQLGFNLGLNDDDDTSNANLDAYGLWYVPETESTCADCCTEFDGSFAWCDTSRLGTLQLLP